MTKPVVNVHVVAIDANMLVSLAVTLAEKKYVPPLLELMRAGYVRLVMSASDAAPVQAEHDSGGIIPRVVRSMIRVYGGDPKKMEVVWAEHLRPYLHVLDPAPLQDTPLSAAVRRRDADDAMLARIAELVGADYFFSSDREAFGEGRWPLMVQTKRSKSADSWPGLGEVTSALRNTHRAQESTETLMLPLPLTALAVQELSKGIGSKLGIHPAVVGVGLSAAVGVIGWRFPTIRAPVLRGLQTYARYVSNIQLTLQERAYNEALLQPYRMTWEPPTEIITSAARRLARSPTGMTTTELAANSKLTVAEWRRWLSAYPGVFEEASRGRWVLAGATSVHQKQETQVNRRV